LFLIVSTIVFVGREGIRRACQRTELQFVLHCAKNPL
jgi:hypothetical protein